MENISLLSTMESLSPPSSAIPSLIGTAAALFLLPLVFALVWKKRHGKAVSLAPLFIGAAGFLVSARVLELGVHMFCIVMDNPVSRFINGHAAAYVLYGALMAGVFEECGRYVVIKFLMKKNKTAPNMVMYGIGHGGVEVWSVTLLSLVSLIAIAVVFETQGAAATLAMLGVPEDATGALAGTAVATVVNAVYFSPVAGFLNVFERFCCMFVHIGLTVVVAYGVLKGEKRWLPIAVAAHIVVDIPAAMLQRGLLSMQLVEAWLILCAVLIFIWARSLYKKMTTPPLKEDMV